MQGVVLSDTFLEAAKGAAGFGEAAVNTFCTASVVGNDACKVGEMFHRIQGMPIDGDLGWVVYSSQRLLMQHFCLLEADGKTKGFVCLEKADDSL